MDHGKVNGVPPQAYATAAQPPRATQSATDRFSRAMGEPPKTTRAQVEPAEIAISNLAWSQYALATQARAMAAPRDAGGTELTQMLERMCSALYVSDKSVGTQRVVMTLDHVMPGAAAEIVREGVHLSIRLHARSEESYRSMSSQRDVLIRALNSSGERRAEVTVVHGDEKGWGDGRG